MYPLHTEQTEKDEGVHKANGTNGNTARVCILYQTRVLLQAKRLMRSMGFFVWHTGRRIRTVFCRCLRQKKAKNQARQAAKGRRSESHLLRQQRDAASKALREVLSGCFVLPTEVHFLGRVRQVKGSCEAWAFYLTTSISAFLPMQLFCLEKGAFRTEQLQIFTSHFGESVQLHQSTNGL